ncbi:MAG: heavy metal-associated domain-containing protein [Chloroherpetonaceae bacterium]|nr:heavy metal-associated domain-containing protein [Chloroherpetonaceae bacterium]
MQQKFIVKGMTCNGCAQTVSNQLKQHPGVEDATVSFLSGEATLQTVQTLRSDELQHLLGLKYTIHPFLSSPPNLNIASEVENDSFIEGTKIQPLKGFSTYRPIFLIFGYILLASVIEPLATRSFNIMQSMERFMAGFFLVFSFFKLLNLKGFAESYAMYDIIAKSFPQWGYVYAFIELGLGIFYLIGLLPLATNLITFIVMSVSIVGVFQSVMSKNQFQCACLGTVFNLPMSSVTIIEDALMILMSFLMIILLTY